MAGPLIGMLGKAGGAMFGSQVGQALGGLAGEVLTATDIGLPLGPAGKAALLPHNIKAFAEGLDVSDGRRAALPRAARGRPPAAVRPRAVAAPAPDRRGRGLRPRRHRSTSPASRRRWASIDPTNPEAIQEALQGGLFEPQQTPAAEGRARPARDHARAGRGLGRRGRRPGHREPDAGRRQAAGGGTPPPGRGRSRRGDVRGAGRARAAAAPAARRLHAVGLAALPPGRRGPRRGLGAPRPAAHRGRPRRPARASARTCPRSPRSATRTSTRPSASCSTGPARPADERPRTRRQRPTPRVSLHADALDVLDPLAALPTTEQDALRAAYVAHLGRAPRRAVALLPPRPPDRRRAGALPRPPARAAQPAPQGAALVPLRRPLRARRRRPWPAPPCARPPRSPASPGCWSTPSRCTSTRTRWRSATLAARSHHLDVRFLAARRPDARARGQRGVARRALVAGRRAAHRRAGHARDGRARPAR